MSVTKKVTKSTKEKGDKKEYGMIPRIRTIRIGEVYFPSYSTLSRANTERVRRILDRSKYTRVFQEENTELLQIIKKLNPSFTQTELKKELTKYEEFEQPKEMAIALVEEVEDIKKLIHKKNQEIEDINKQTNKQLKILKEEHTLKTKEINKISKDKIKDIKKDVQQLEAEAKKLLTRAEKYKNIKRNV